MTQCSTHYHKHTHLYTHNMQHCARTPKHKDISSLWKSPVWLLRWLISVWGFNHERSCLALCSHTLGGESSWLFFFLVEKYILHRTLPLYQSSLILGNSNCSQRSLSKVVGGGKRKRHLNTSPLRQDLATRQTSWQRSQAVISGLIRPSLYVNE